MFLVRICIFIYVVARILTRPTDASNDARKLSTFHNYTVVDIILQYIQYIQYIKDFGQKKSPAAVSECQLSPENDVGASIRDR